MSRKLPLLLSDLIGQRLQKADLLQEKVLEAIQDALERTDRPIDLNKTITTIRIPAIEGSPFDISDPEALSQDIKDFFDLVIELLTKNTSQEKNIPLFKDYDLEQTEQVLASFKEFLKLTIKNLDEIKQELKIEQDETQKKEGRSSTGGSFSLPTSGSKTPDVKRKDLDDGTYQEVPVDATGKPLAEVQKNAQVALTMETYRMSTILENFLIQNFEFDKAGVNHFPPEIQELIRIQVNAEFSSLDISSFLKDGKIDQSKMISLRAKILRNAISSLQHNQFFLASIQLIEAEVIKKPAGEIPDKDIQDKLEKLTTQAEQQVEGQKTRPKTILEVHIAKETETETDTPSYHKQQSESFEKQILQVALVGQFDQRLIDTIVKDNLQRGGGKPFSDFLPDLVTQISGQYYDLLSAVNPRDRQLIFKKLNSRLDEVRSQTTFQKLRMNLQTAKPIVDVQSAESFSKQFIAGLDYDKLKNTVITTSTIESLLQDRNVKLTPAQKRDLLPYLKQYQANLLVLDYKDAIIKDAHSASQQDHIGAFRNTLKEFGIDGTTQENVITTLTGASFARMLADNVSSDLQEVFNQIDPRINQSPELQAVFEKFIWEQKATNGQISHTWLISEPSQTKQENLEEVEQYQKLQQLANTVAIAEAMSGGSNELNDTLFSEADNELYNSVRSQGGFYPSPNDGENAFQKVKNWQNRIKTLNTLRKRLTGQTLKKLGLQVAKQVGSKFAIPLIAGGLGLGAGIALIAKALQAASWAAGAAMGATGGALVGGFFLGPVGAAMGAVGGGLLGGVTGANNANAINALNTAKSMVGEVASKTTSASQTIVSNTANIITGNTGATLGIPIGATVAGTVGGVIAVSVYSMATILGAFMPDANTSSIGYQEGEFSRYLDVRKVATPAKIENGTISNIEYQITFTPKLGASISITSLEDTFSQLPKNQPLTYPFNEQTALQQMRDQLINKPFTEPQTFRYTVSGVSGEDVLVTNTISVDFTATSAEISDSESLSAIASLRIGNPKIGCFEFVSGGQPFRNITSVEWEPGEQERLIRVFLQRAGTNAGFVQVLCEKGDIQIYRLRGTQYGGWAPGVLKGQALGLYDAAFSFSEASTEYTFVHELGHIADYRNPGLRTRFVQERSTTSCFTYPFPAMCSEYEAFAEGLMLYVVHSTYEFSSGRYGGGVKGRYDFPSRNPVEYNWFKNNIFGGLECDANSCTN